MAADTGFIMNNVVDRAVPPIPLEEEPSQIGSLLSKLSLENSHAQIESLASRECTLADPVLALFASDRLLARAMESEVVRQMDLDRERLCFTSYTEEMSYMQSDETLRNASCTLLVSGQEVATYKPYGFLFDANTAKILHASPQDTNSCTDRDGSLITQGESLTIEELAAFVRKTPISDRESMNEVNANFATKDLRGLFVCRGESNLSLLETLAVKGMLKDKYKLDLQVYIYNPKTGQLTLYAPDKEVLRRELLKVKVGVSKEVGISRARAFAPYLGLEVDARGRIS